MNLRKIAAALSVMLLMVVAAPTIASANTINLLAVNGNLFQQTVQNPCIFANPSCKQPNGFVATDVPNQGNTTNYDISVTYTGSTLQALLNGQSLVLGLDINQASGQGPQTLGLFTMAINGTVVDTYTGFAGNVPAGNNGNGYADYLLTGFSSFGANDQVTFRFKMDLQNDGAENVFLIGGPNTCDNCTPTPTGVVPEPASMLLVGTGLLAAVRARRKMKA